MQEKEDFDVKLAIECAAAFAGSSELGCVVSGAKGEVLYTAGYSCAACRMCDRSGFRQDNCVQSQVYGMTQSERFDGKYIYFCPLGLTCFVSPILGKDGSTGRVTVGPFLMVEREDFAECDLSGHLGLAGEPLSSTVKELENIPVLPPDKVNKLSTLLFMAVGFINNVSSANHMLDTQASEAIQGQINEYIMQLKREDAAPYPFDTERALLKAIAQSDKAQAQRLLNELFGYIFFAEGGDLEEVKTRIYELLVLISRTAVEAGADPENTLRQSHRYRQALTQIKDTASLSFWLTAVMDEYMDSVFNFVEEKHADVIHKAVQYLWKHNSEKITLNEMAAMTYLSPAYFSRVFKNETGRPFNKYLNRLRVEKAKEMLLYSSRHLADISLACGFEDQSYFTKVFKKATGMAPLRFRDTKGGLMQRQNEAETEKSK